MIEEEFDKKVDFFKKELNKRDIADACRKLIEKKDFEGLYNLGRILEEKGRNEEAAQVYAKASKLVS